MMGVMGDRDTRDEREVGVAMGRGVGDVHFNGASERGRCEGRGGMGVRSYAKGDEG